MKRVEELHVYVKYPLFFLPALPVRWFRKFIFNKLICLFFHDYYAICYLNASSFLESSCALGSGSYIACKLLYPLKQGKLKYAPPYCGHLKLFLPFSSLCG